MPHLLRIDASTRTDGSFSRTLGDRAEARWRAANPGGTVTTRTITDGSIPPIAQDTITGFYTPPEAITDDLRAATALSDTLIAELQQADTLLLTTPIYNFTVPAALKAWIDQIVRIGHTFAYEDGSFRGLVQTRRAIVACAYGAEGYLNDGPLAGADFLAPYLKFLLGFLGIEDIQIVGIEGTTGDLAALSQKEAQAIAAIEARAA
ncbi:FMN-dependent NADH-azoreductase [Aestuariibius sp. 2305UL40-4]|uniref:FMN-dependent NADH-azoreductase n=1 Tax=Aestuariibius violaceus TaxID=3234132 RepID=UPI00345E7321